MPSDKASQLIETILYSILVHRDTQNELAPKTLEYCSALYMESILPIYKSSVDSQNFDINVKRSLTADNSIPKDLRISDFFDTKDQHKTELDKSEIDLLKRLTKEIHLDLPKPKEESKTSIVFKTSIIQAGSLPILKIMQHLYGKESQLDFMRDIRVKMDLLKIKLPEQIHIPKDIQDEFHDNRIIKGRQFALSMESNDKTKENQLYLYLPLTSTIFFENKTSTPLFTFMSPQSIKKLLRNLIVKISSIPFIPSREILTEKSMCDKAIKEAGMLVSSAIWTRVNFRSVNVCSNIIENLYNPIFKNYLEQSCEKKDLPLLVINDETIDIKSPSINSEKTKIEVLNNIKNAILSGIGKNKLHLSHICNIMKNAIIKTRGGLKKITDLLFKEEISGLRNSVEKESKDKEKQEEICEYQITKNNEYIKTTKKESLYKIKKYAKCAAISAPIYIVMSGIFPFVGIKLIACGILFPIIYAIATNYKETLHYLSILANLFISLYELFMVAIMR